MSTTLGAASPEGQGACIVGASSLGTTGLSPEHRDKIRTSALTEQQIDALGWFSRRNGSLVIPYLAPDGSPQRRSNGEPFYRWRLSPQQIEALKRQGVAKPGKYRSPRAEGCRLFHSPLAIRNGSYDRRLNDPTVPLRITEGELKVVAANVHDPKRITIGIGGVNSWRDRRAGGPQSEPLPELAALPLYRREVRLCFDSDLDKPQVIAALQELAEYLASMGAHVLIETLPNGLDGERLGLDDLIHRHGPELFHRIAAIARSPFKVNSKGERSWCFTAEPRTTRERVTYLAGMIGQHWRADTAGRDRWQRWTGTHWVEVDGDDAICRQMEAFAELQGWENRELSTFRSLQAAFRRSISSNATPPAPGLLPFKNGCLRLETLTLVSHNPSYGNTWCLPYDWDPAARCDRIQGFLADRLGDAASVALFRAFARGLLMRQRMKSFLEISGPSNTGKSVLANLLMALVGAENTEAGTLERLEDRSLRFETVRFRGKGLAIFSEAHRYSGSLDTLKAFTGGDPISAERKGSHAACSFTFHGGVVVVGNGPIRASDTSGAVINRRRSLHVGKVVGARNERDLLERSEDGGWFGELADELPGLAAWALAMAASEAREALARDVQSISRAEAELETLLETDYLAAWADEFLVWDEASRARIGLATDSAGDFMYASYLQFLDGQGPKANALALRSFKAKLVDLLRDTLGLPLPDGNTRSGAYRMRGLGSVVPCVRFRHAMDGEAPGVVRHGFLARIETTPGTDAEQIGNAKTPLGNGWNGSNGFEELPDVRADDADGSNGENAYRGNECPGTRNSRSIRSPQGFSGSESVPLSVPPPEIGARVEVKNSFGVWAGGYEVISGPDAQGLIQVKGQTGRKQHRRPTDIRRPAA